jgi:hypothetical protein
MTLDDLAAIVQDDVVTDGACVLDADEARRAARAAVLALADDDERLAALFDDIYEHLGLFSYPVRGTDVLEGKKTIERRRALIAEARAASPEEQP